MQPAPTAYSYVRFSSKKQEEGDSIRRQTELTAAWAQRAAIQLDTSLSPDRGVSAFKGRNRDLGALGEFLRLVDSGRVRSGSYLVVESLDRLTREEIQPALLLILSLLQKGIRVVQLKPVEHIYDSASDTTPIILMLVELSRGHSESKVKSERNTAAWDRRRALAREGQLVLTKHLPAWLERRDGKVVAIPDRVKVVRRVFDLALKGHGISLIASTLEKAKVPTWGKAGVWRRNYIAKVLASRAVLGEFQFFKAELPDGAPVKDYFPKVIEPPMWDRVQAAIKSRTKASGPIGKAVANLFTGLLRDARSGGRMYISHLDSGSGAKRKRRRMLIPASVVNRGQSRESFPNDVFEPAMLAFLKEINPTDVIGEVPESESAQLAADVAGLDARIAALEAELAGEGDSKAISRAVRALEAKRADVNARLVAARRADATPLATIWTEARTLLDTAVGEPGRLRLRGLLIDALSEVWVLRFRAPGRVFCVAQVYFRSGTRRELLIDYKAGTHTRPTSWESRAFTGLPADFDLRTPAGVALVESLLTGDAV